MSGPATPPAEIELLSVHLDQDPADVAELRSLLDDSERQRADAFHFEKDRLRWTVARAALRIAISRRTGTSPEHVAITLDSHGKPHLAQPNASVHFNLSHSGNQALILLAGLGPVGVDLESSARGATLLECAEAFLSPSEHREVDALPDRDSKARQLLKTWCAKEAYLKAKGTGFHTPPETITLEIGPRGTGRIHGPGETAGIEIHFPHTGVTSDFFAAVALPDGQACPQITTLQRKTPWR